MYPIKIRANHAGGADLTFDEAVLAAMGQGERPETRLSVTAVYAEQTTIGPQVYDAGRSVFGLDADVSCRRIRFGEDSDAGVSISGIATQSPEVAQVRIACYTLAAQIAAAANAAAAALKAATAS